MKKKLIQFGDKFDKGVFIIPPYQNSMSTELEHSDNDVMTSAGGSFYIDCGDKQITKRTFELETTLYSKGLQDEYQNNKCCNDHNKDENPTASLLWDSMVRGLRGGVKKLFAQMEDGSIKYTYAKAYAPSYSIDKDEECTPWTNVNIKFESVDPYWYNDFKDTFFFDDIPYSAMLNNCVDLVGFVPLYQMTSAQKLKKKCDYRGVILCDPSVYDKFPSLNPANNFSLKMQSGICARNKINKNVCVAGSTGGRLCIRFTGHYNNPTFTNVTTGAIVKYNGQITGREYLKLTANNDVIVGGNGFEIDTNIPNFDSNLIEITQGENSVNFASGGNNFCVEGGYSVASYFNFSPINTYL